MVTGKVPWRLAVLVVLVTAWLLSPVSAIATTVTFQPSEARPGTDVTVTGALCTYQGSEQIVFSDRFFGQLPDGETERFKPDAVVFVTPIGGEQTEFGLNTSVQRFTVPRLPVGDYYLYFNCLDASVCCIPLEPTFRILAVPDTGTASLLRAEPSTPWWVLGLAFALGLGMGAIRMRSTRSRVYRS
jgi:hypothetical protein